MGNIQVKKKKRKQQNCYKRSQCWCLAEHDHFRFSPLSFFCNLWHHEQRGELKNKKKNDVWSFKQAQVKRRHQRGRELKKKKKEREEEEVCFSEHWHLAVPQAFNNNKKKKNEGKDFWFPGTHQPTNQQQKKKKRFTLWCKKGKWLHKKRV